MDALHSRTILISLLCVALRGSLAIAAVVRAVRPGDTVTLPCDITLQHETMWFIQPDDTPPLLGISVMKTAGNKINPISFVGDVDPRYSPELNSSSRSVSLRIRNISDADLALYYCAGKEGGRITVGTGTRLVYEGERDISLHSCEERRNITQSPGETSCLLPLWVTPVSALLCALLAAVCGFCLGHRPGKSGYCISLYDTLTLDVIKCY
ncbi:uncharacterized protein LOC136771679 [Amia ocellicauda]|uniref:uncharacterized protein LOC136771679 n=1 Tax=Amia ocellicauda TaxID=2972642 RepID=UPI0034642E2E